MSSTRYSLLTVVIAAGCAFLAVTSCGFVSSYAFAAPTAVRLDFGVSVGTVALAERPRSASFPVQ